MDGSVGFVVDWWVVLGVVVCPIVTALIPVVAKLLNGEVGDANSSGVVLLNGRAWLRSTHFDEGLMEGGHFLGGGVESTKFGFGGRRHDKFHYLTD
jgi:hypothetical protein